MEYFSSESPVSPAYCLSKEKKKNGKTRSKVVKLSTDPQSVAARERRHRISNRFKILQSMVPGGTKMDIVSMLEEAIHYVKFLKAQIWLHQSMINFADDDPFTLVNIPSSVSFPVDQEVLCPLINVVDPVEHVPPLPPSGPYFPVEQTLSCDSIASLWPLLPCGTNPVL